MQQYFIHIYVTAHRCAGGLKIKLDLWSDSQRHRHFVGFFNVPVQAPALVQPFYSYSEKLPISVPFYDVHSDTYVAMEQEAQGATIAHLCRVSTSVLS